MRALWSFRVLVGFAILTTSTSPVAWAKAPKAWKGPAIQIVGAYEGKGFGQVTADTDCQGLSLGIEQSTVVSGSILKVVDKIAPAQFRASVSTLMPTVGTVFLEIIKLLRQNDMPLAREKSLELQLTENSNKCVGGKRGISMKPEAQAELEAWLTSDVVKAAQVAVADDKLETSFALAECFLRTFAERPVTHFRHFLFFYGFVVQGGGKGLADKTYQNATSLVNEHKMYQITPEVQKFRKVTYLVDWFEKQWSNTHDVRYFNDAQKNAEWLRSIEPTLTKVDVQLLFIRHIRAVTGNTPYQLVFMGRGLIDLTGKGWINSTPFDHSETFKKLGEAPESDRVSVTCR